MSYKNYNLVTGAVVALLGKESTSGEFEVEEVILPGQLEQSPIIGEEEPRYFAFASGLNFGENNNGSLELLLEFLLGGFDIGNIKSRDIIKVVVAGNIYGPLNPKESYKDPTSKIDCFLNQVCQSIPVYLIPGANDPTTRALPQQPLHSGLFNATNSLPTLHLASNPLDVELMGLRIMGTAGQPINDLKKCGSDVVTSLDWLEATLKFGHFAPTSPDTLYCYPYSNQDPFVLTACPHIFFAGNQDEFATRMIAGDNGQQTRMITIPSFSTSGQIVLVEASTLATTLINVKPCIGPQ
ncbi:DNA polymerase delta subunit 2 [Entomophthora muscae]|uniref:DNA polymerase delta subunit 2 n=1 Tax=Entomophthora muscae TaxID=34485 RepID=A0ACC2UFA6_9FUNG|nr:DNA polymerase delta subunit 2 [Entomophthora muscae]